MTTVRANTVELNCNTYTGLVNIKGVNCNNVSWENNDMTNAFAGCSNLQYVNNIHPNVQDMHYTFNECVNITNISALPPSVTNLFGTFYNCKSLVNVPNLSGLNNVNSISYAFYGCSNLVNAPVLPPNIVNMSYTFSSCANLVNAPVIPDSVKDLDRTFYGCNSLVNAPDMPNSVNKVLATFGNCINLVNAGKLSNNITNMYCLYQFCSKLSKAPVIPNSVTDMSQTFLLCTDLVNAPLIPNSVTQMHGTFYGCKNLVNAPSIPNSVTNMYQTFTSCYKLVNAPSIPNSVITLWNCFRYCINLVNAPNMDNATKLNNLSQTFTNCTNLTGNIYINSYNITNATECFHNTSATKNVYIPFNISCSSTYNTIGSPTIVGNIISNFNASNYLELPTTSTVTSIEAVAKVKVSSLNETVGQIYWSLGAFALAVQSSGSGKYKLHTNGGTSTSGSGSWNSELISTNEFNYNQYYWFKIIYDGVTRSIYYSTDGISWIFDSSINCNNVLSNRKFYMLNAHGWTNQYFNGEVDLGESYIKFNNTTYWRFITGQIPTTTYNAFINAGYDNAGTQDGVYLKDLTPTLTINPNVSDATVTLSASGYTQSGNSITVKVGTTVTWTVSRDEYITQTGTKVVDESETLNITLVERNAFKFTTTVGSGLSKSLNMSISTTRSYDMIINWGDLTSTKIPGSSTDVTLLTHTYPVAGDYQIKITSTEDKTPYIIFNYDTTIKSVDSNLLEMDADDLSQMFGYCSNLQTISADTFKLNPQVKHFYGTFIMCASLQAIPAGLFRYNVNVGNGTSVYSYNCFDRTFRGCSTITSIPEDLFRYTVNAYEFDGCFNGCTNLETIPDDLFAYCPNVHSEGTNGGFNATFANCNKLTYNPNIFGSDKTIYAGASAISFKNMFKRTSFTGLNAGTAPDLWNFTLPASTEKTDCFTGAGNETLTNYYDIPIAWGGSGVTLTISPTPNDATVTLTASGYTQVGNSIAVDKGTSVAWSVSKASYETQTGTKTVNASETMNITLDSEGHSVDVTGFEYTNENKNLILTSYIGSEPNVVIPNIGDE